MNNKYEAFLDPAGCDLNEPSLYLPAHDVSQKERDRIYDEILADWEAELSSEYELEKARIEAGLLDAHYYLYGKANNDSDEPMKETDLPLASRFNAKHVRENRRKASLKAKTRKIALGMPKTSKAYRTILGIRDNVYQTVHYAQTMLKDHVAARRTLRIVQEEFLRKEATFESAREYVFLDGYYRSFLLSGFLRVTTDMMFASEHKMFPVYSASELSEYENVMSTSEQKIVPVYSTSEFSQYHTCVRLAHKGKSLFKLAKHYDIFSPKKGRFFKKQSNEKGEPKNKSETYQEVVKGPKKSWTQEEILVAKVLEDFSAHKHQTSFTNTSRAFVQDSSFGKRSKRNIGSVTASELIMVPHAFTPLVHSYITHNRVMCYHPC